MLLMLVRPSPTSRLLVLVPCAALLAVIVSSSSPASGVRAQPSDEVRALWVTRSTLGSTAAVAQMVRSAQESGFNTLIVQVRARGDAYYASTLEPRAAELSAQPDFDPLAETLTLARRAGLGVHAWISVNLVSNAVDLPAARQHIVYRHPEWLMVPRDLATEMLSIDPRNPEYLGRLARWTRARSTEVEGLYSSPVDSAATLHLADLVRELVQRYSVDGVHLDYARYPHEAFDYSRTALQHFKRAVRPELSERERSSADVREIIDPLAYPSLFADRWQMFHRSRLTALIMRLRTVVKAVRPNAIVSAAVIPDVDQAYESRFQDWRTWLDQSLIDVLCPMAYSKEVGLFERQVGLAKDFAGDRPVWVGVGAYRLSSSETIQHITAARRLRAAGVILFSYEALVTAPNSTASLTALGRAAFGAGSD